VLRAPELDAGLQVGSQSL